MSYDSWVADASMRMVLGGAGIGDGHVHSWNWFLGLLLSPGAPSSSLVLGWREGSRDAVGCRCTIPADRRRGNQTRLHIRSCPVMFVCEN